MRPIARARNYAELLRAIDARRRELGMPMMEVDGRSGLPLGYTGKLFTDPAKPNAKTLGRLSLGLLLGALELELVVVRAPRCGKSEAEEAGVPNAETVSDRMKRLGSAGGRKWVESRSREQVLRAVRKASRARWAKHRAKKKAERLAADAKAVRLLRKALREANRVESTLSQQAAPEPIQLAKAA